MNEHKHHPNEEASGSTTGNQPENAPESGDATKSGRGRGLRNHGERTEMLHGSMPETSAEKHAEMMQEKSGSEDLGKMPHSSTGGTMAMSGGHGSMSHGAGGMNAADHETAMWRESLWASFVNLLLGAWLVTSPFTFGYRSAAMTWSDVISGSLIIVFSLLSAYKGFLGNVARWANCFVGIWLLFAPLVFWTPDAAAYANDTLVGALVIAFAVLVTMMPGMDMRVMMDGADVPPGWSYNPSTWMQRAPIILLALVGFLASRYMAAFQLGHINTAWDPFFGEGTRRVLTSDVSKMFPISDAGLGAVSYVIEILMGFMGDRARWRTMPWMVTFFGILVVPLGATSVILIILQPLSVGAWCSLCLLAGIAMLAMVPATLDEVVAMIQFMAQAKREGKPLWRTFWLGGVIEGEKDDRLTPFDWSNPISSMFVPYLASNWNLFISISLGVWLLFAPAVFGTAGRASDSDRLLGALVVTFTAIAVAEVGRPVRFLNILFGAWIIIAPFLLAGYTPAGFVGGIVTGFALIILSFPLGRIRASYGSWNRYIR
jgi:uncharacterized membrane protein